MRRITSEHFSRRARRSGFTLIEMLIVLAITALLAGIILVYSSESRDQVALFVEEAKLAQTISKAKSLTVSTYDQPTVPCGYGVHVDYDNTAAPTYTLFAYDENDPSSHCQITALDPTLETPLTTNQLAPDLAFGNPNGAIEDILFLPPNPDTWVWLYGDTATSTQGQIPLTSKSGKLSVSIAVSSAGQITF